jgi:chemotaxis protein MotB
MAGKGGGAWKVAYADFVTAMMAFFLVMWIVAQNKPVKEAIAQYFNDPAGTSSKASSSNTMLPTRKNTGSPPVVGAHKGGLGRGKGAPKPVAKSTSAPDPKGAVATKPSLLVIHDGNQSHVGTVLQFDEFSGDLDDVAKNRLSDLAPLLLGKPNKIEIRGHASKRPLPKDSTFKSPWEISYVRCLVTMNFLVENGISPDRIRMSQAGPFEPQTLQLEAELAAQNARVEVFMLGEFVDDFKGTREERDGDHPGHNAPAPTAPAGE